HRERGGELTGLRAGGRDRPKGPMHHLGHVHVSRFEEVAGPQLRDEVRDPRQLEIPRLPEPLEDDLLHGSCAVHQLDELELSGLESVVEEPSRVRDHGVVVAPSKVEGLHLDVLREPRPALQRIQRRPEPLPEAWLTIPTLAREPRRERTPQTRTGRDRAHDEDSGGRSAAMRRWIAEYTDRRGTGRRREATRLHRKAPRTSASRIAVRTVPHESPPAVPGARIDLTMVARWPKSSTADSRKRAFAGIVRRTSARNVIARSAPPVVTTMSAPFTAR